ncbi:MAG: hypothetical protein K2P09_00010 [Erysipelotrichales bacterium]|nr:hypothetical protein [Erysipelotrichales bacterium]
MIKELKSLEHLSDKENHILTQLSYYSETMELGETIGEWINRLEKTNQVPKESRFKSLCDSIKKIII